MVYMLCSMWRLWVLRALVGLLFFGLMFELAYFSNPRLGGVGALVALVGAGVVAALHGAL